MCVFDFDDVEFDCEIFCLPFVCARCAPGVWQRVRLCVCNHCYARCCPTYVLPPLFVFVLHVCARPHIRLGPVGVWDEAFSTVIIYFPLLPFLLCSRLPYTLLAFSISSRSLLLHAQCLSSKRERESERKREEEREHEVERTRARD